MVFKLVLFDVAQPGRFSRTHEEEAVCLNSSHGDSNSSSPNYVEWAGCLSSSLGLTLPTIPVFCE